VLQTTPWEAATASTATGKGYTESAGNAQQTALPAIFGRQTRILKLLLNNHDPIKLHVKCAIYEYIARGRSTWLNMLRVNLAQLNEVAQQTQQRVGKLRRCKKKKMRSRKSWKKISLARQQVISQFAQQLKQQRHEIGRLQRDENRLSQLVAKLSKILTRQKAKGYSTMINCLIIASTASRSSNLKAN